MNFKSVIVTPGNTGFYWSSSFANDFDFKNPFVTTAYVNLKFWGFSLRCLAIE